MQKGRQNRAANGVDRFPVEVESLQAAVAAIRHHQDRGLRAGIDHQCVRRAQRSKFFTGACAFSAEGSLMVSVFVVTIYVPRAIAVSDVEISVGGDGYVGRPV